jgi:predicted secreted protein
VKPTGKVSGESGVIAIDDNTGATTIKLTAGLVTPAPDTATEISVVPIAIPVATPFEDMVAMLVSELVQVKFDVRYAVEPSE